MPNLEPEISVLLYTMSDTNRNREWLLSMNEA